MCHNKILLPGNRESRHVVLFMASSLSASLYSPFLKCPWSIIDLFRMLRILRIFILTYFHQFPISNCLFQFFLRSVSVALMNPIKRQSDSKVERCWTWTPVWVYDITVRLAETGETFRQGLESWSITNATWNQHSLRLRLRHHQECKGDRHHYGHAWSTPRISERSCKEHLRTNTLKR